MIPRNKIIYKLATEPKKFLKLTIYGVEKGLKNLTTAEQRTKLGEQSSTLLLTAPKKIY